MICPKAKRCNSPTKDLCNMPHEKEQDCLRSTGKCPACVPVKAGKESDSLMRVEVVSSDGRSEILERFGPMTRNKSEAIMGG